MYLEGLRRSASEAGREMERLGLVASTWGSYAAKDRVTGHVVVKPSGMPYASIKPADVVVVDLDGRVIDGRRVPSTETPTFLRIFQRLPEVFAIVHTHSTWATAHAAAGREIPVIIGELAEAVGGPVPVTSTYHRFGTRELGDAACDVLSDRRSVLLRHHGLICIGSDLEEAIYTAMVVEEAAKVHAIAMCLGGAQSLPAEEVAALYHLHWTSYGQRHAHGIQR